LIARLTNTQSAFGEQYDSMADMLSFCVAPALLMYFWQFEQMGKIGWIGAKTRRRQTESHLAIASLQ
jgi:CDP-diacylglycerol--serine O-phosphatidyltransferase